MLKVVIYHNDYVLYNSDSTKRKEAKVNAREIALHRSIRRTKTTIADIIACNSFELWCTFTFDRRKVDRFDASACRRIMSLWLNRQRQTSPSLEYIIVPEYHKKCESCVESKAESCDHKDSPKAIHFHAFMRGFRGRLKETKQKDNGRIVYRFSGFRSGRSHCVRISNNPDDHRNIGNYMQKYITKDMPLIFGKKRFWSSKGLTRPTTHVNGLFKFNLWNTVRGNTPVYINDKFEIQNIVTSVPVDLSASDRQTMLNIGVDRLKQLRCKKDPSLLDTYAHLLQ